MQEAVAVVMCVAGDAQVDALNVGLRYAGNGNGIIQVERRQKAAAKKLVVGKQTLVSP